MADRKNPARVEPEPTVYRQSDRDPETAKPSAWRAIARHREPERSSQSGMFERALGIARTVAPIAGKVAPLARKILPLLEGNIATAVANVLSPPPPAAHVDLEPIENALARMRREGLELRGQIGDHTATLNRIQEHLETVRDATERNALEQRELMQDMLRLRAKVTLGTWLGIALLTGSILINILFFARLAHLIHG